MPLPACNNSLYSWPLRLTAHAPTAYTKFEVRRRHTFCFSINHPVDLDLWPFDLETGASYCRGVGNLPTNFIFSGTFRSRLMGCQTDHVSLRPWPLTMEVTALVGDTGLRAPSFVGLPVLKILRIYCLSVNRPGNLDLWSRSWCTLTLLPVRWATFLLFSVFVSLFVLDL